MVDDRFGKRDAEVVGLGQLKVVHLHESHDGLVDRSKLDEGHAVVVGEELEVLDGETSAAESLLDGVLLGRRRDVGQVESVRGGVDVLVVLGARALEAVERRVGVVLGQLGRVRLALLRHLDLLVLGRHHADLLAPDLNLETQNHGSSGYTSRH